ncbi:separase-like isoform X2 [Chenopodium quinoa]|uniref:separase-like isoform X2 n=1 Tax=Chenopodium quinoa TaxID=63459 RepID=UPI000B794F6A|nr:separase-like isoform X2 [Chenopodium quinoa]
MDEQTQASSLISKLETYEFAEIYTLFSEFLQPFSLLNSTKPQNPSKKPSRSKKPSQFSPSSPIRSLAKTFLSFVSQSLSLLPKCLSESPKHPKTREFVAQLLDCYILCLDCLDVMSSELSGKPYCVHLQRGRYVHCLIRWERYEDAINEGFRVLKDLGGVKLEGAGWKVSMGELVPRLIVVDFDDNGGVEVEEDFVHLIVDLVVAVAQSVSLSKVKDAGKYTGLLILLDEVHPWFRHLETSVCSKLQWKLLAHMKNAALFLVREVTHFKGDLVPGFCAAVFNEYTQLLKAQSIQGTTTEEQEEFVKFVSNCTSKCRSASKNVRVSIAMHLYKSADNFSQGFSYFTLIQRFHALGLYFYELCFESNNCMSSTSGSSTGSHSVGFSPNDWDQLKDLSCLLCSGKKYYPSHLEVYVNPLSHDFRDYVEKASISSRAGCKISKSFKSTNGEEILSYYLNALKFLCWPLADFVTSERKRIIVEDTESPLGEALKHILEAFLEYSYLFSHCQQNSESRVEIDMIVLNISVACFTLSLKLNLITEGSTRLVNYILSDECTSLLRPHMLKYIIAMLHNNFVEFYRHEQFKEAFDALELCSRASWNRCLLLCEIHVGKQNGVDGEVSETMIAESVNEACKVGYLLIDIDHRIDSGKVEKAIDSGLVKWCLAKNLLRQLPCPVTLIKNWTKMQCKLYKNTEDDAPILGYNLLQSPCLAKNNISSEIVGTILEQELSAYQEMSNLYPIFCQRMQMNLIDTLLKKLYISSKCLQRSTILVKKGLLLRTFGIENLDDCIRCLSKAIESVNGLSGDKVYNQLAVVYCLRALSSHEADPTSKDMFRDIHEAVDLWLTTIDVFCCSSSGNCGMGCESVLQLLYHIADLLSIKGDVTLHAKVLSVIMKVFKQLNVPLEKCLSLLWESRRVNHALCAVPINEAFIEALSKHYGKEAESLEFWISCFKDSQPLLVGLQQNFSFLSSLFPLAFFQRKHSLQSEISVDEVKKIASNLLSNVSVSRSSAFLAGYIYHDLSEWLCAGGRTIEAFVYAKEAHRLRGKLLQEHFSCSIQQYDENQKLEESIRKSSAVVSQLSVLNQIAIRAWPVNSVAPSLDSSSLSPWNVLRCYLESTLQVGIIHEKLGNVAEAEAQFILGKSISCLQCLPRFIFRFSSCLGKIYHGMGLLDLASTESSEQNLDFESNSMTCSRCLLMLESDIIELGNLRRKGVDCAPGNPYESSILNLLSLEESRVSHSVHECDAAISGIDTISRPTKAKAIVEAKRTRKTKKELETQVTVNSCAAEQNKRVTRSRKLSSNAKSTAFVKDGKNVTTCQTNGQLETEEAVVSKKISCQKCFSSELNLFGSLACFIQMKWEFVRRQQILRLLIGLGKHQGALVGTHRLHTIYSKCIFILLGGNDCHCSSSTVLDFDSISKEIPGDILVSERAEVLYNICFFSLKALCSEDIRTTCFPFCCIQMSHVISFLKLSFVLSREIPLLFQKVSRLLALVYVVSSSKKNFSSLISCKVLSESYWAAYFHQASVGSHHDLQLLSAISLKHKSQLVSKNEGCEAADATSVTDTCKLLRTVPESTKDMESCVAKFFENLPSTTIVCVSILGASYASLLKELMCCPSTVYGWMLLSHFDADSQPAVIMLPLSTVIQEEEPNTSCSIFGEKNVLKEWCSPWGSNALVDDVAPLFKLILRGNYLSCSSFPEEHTEKSRELWWTLRDNLDKCLHKLLWDIEEKWLGQWKYLLLGRWLDTDPLKCAVKEFMDNTRKDGCILDINESIVKIVIGGIKSINMEKLKIPKSFLEKGCFIGSIIDSVRGLDKEYDGVHYVSDLLIAAANQVELECCSRREPVVLVLDSDIQMLPWESIPIMREQEVYRMPSVASIFMALQRRSVLEEAARLGTKFPLIDPLDAFYLLNPSGDLSRTQSEFEEWFRYQNMQGKAGVVPSTEELRAALENHDLFLYFGHGSGAQYMPRDKIQKLESCSAMLLMGCSSGSLNLNGCYAPVGTSLSYMLAGAPIVVANLWEVTDLDIDRFAKAVLKYFFEERSMSSTDCIQCSLLAEELESMSVNERKRNPKKGRGKKKAVDPVPDVSGEYCYKHKLRAGYFVSQARKACKLPFLIGAAPVCYGVPTGIKKKKDI